MKKGISIPQSEGVTSKQAHADLPQSAPYEREISRDGFSGPATHLHHKHPPTGWGAWDGPLCPRAFNLKLLDADTVSPWDSKAVLYNSDCQIRFWRCSAPMTSLCRNADGDELFFVHEGEADLFCDFGHMKIVEGDYVLIPRSSMWRLEPKKSICLLMIEATNDRFGLPEKGLMGHHAIFDAACMEHPKINQTFLDQQDEKEWQLNIKKDEQMTRVIYPFNPLDAVGWHGDVYAVKINWRDIRPVMSHRYHLPPSAHTTFICDQFIVCTFVPRPVESDPGALRVPFYHSNDEYDEVLFYHAGDFFSRDNIDAGMLSFHPCGFTHGPHPKAYKAGLEFKKKATDEVAVMIDTRNRLAVNEKMLDPTELKSYVASWQE
ncbi:MAG: homogentisate 1,2-dioxygenase [Pseudomonadales bacterium]|nr:homogentisate 1,2-dioxygenase [Pseudomonadales bacterium]